MASVTDNEDWVEVPAARLSPEVLTALLEEFITREGTDYGHTEKSLDEKRERGLQALQRGDVVIVFNLRDERTTLMSREDFCRGSREIE